MRQVLEEVQPITFKCQRLVILKRTYDDVYPCFNSNNNILYYQLPNLIFIIVSAFKNSGTDDAIKSLHSAIFVTAGTKHTFPYFR